MESPRKCKGSSLITGHLKVSYSLQELKIPKDNSRKIIKNPGPADYCFKMFDERFSPSFSTKGFGSIISKCPRFLPELVTSPGPGSYSIDDTKAASVSIGSPFACRFSPKVYQYCTPAPGDYSPRVIKNVKSCVSSFVSKCKRMEIPSPASPDPWHYCPDETHKNKSNSKKNPEKLSLSKSIKDEKNSKLKKSNSPKNTFGNKSSENLKKLQNNQNLNTFHQNVKKFNNKIYNPIFNEKLESTPGPGMYEVNQKWLKKSTKIIEKEVKSVKIQEFPSPGPGSYFKNSEVIKSKAQSSFFISKVPRELTKKKILAPGPAYYSPKYLSKKISFL
jgi:hypothetical protein